MNKSWGYHGHIRSHRHGVPISPHSDARVNCAFLGLFLAGAISANWTDECLHGVMSLVKLDTESSVILLRTAIHDPAFLLVRVFPPAFSLSQRVQSRDSGLTVYVSKLISSGCANQAGKNWGANKPNDAGF